MLAVSFKHAYRALSRHRTFTLTAVLALGLTIGISATVYSLFDALLYPDLGIHRPEDLYRIAYYGNSKHLLTQWHVEAAVTNALGAAGQATGYGSFGRRGALAFVSQGVRYRQVSGTTVRRNFFTVLGKQPSAGRAFLPSDSGHAVALISQRLAAELFANKSPLNGILTINQTPYTVIGVMPQQTGFPGLDGDFWVLGSRDGPPIPLLNIVRLPGQLSMDQWRQRMAVAAHGLARDAGERPEDTAFILRALATRQFHVGGFQRALIGAALALLIIACANLANLQLARLLRRMSEFAVRRAIGGSRRDVFMGVLAETSLLVVGGLIAGGILAYWGIAALHAAIPDAIADLVIQPVMTWRVWLAVAVASILALMTIGIYPSLQASRVQPLALLNTQLGLASRRSRRLNLVLIGLQIALAMPLATAGALLVRSAWRLHSADYLAQTRFGYDPRQILVAVVRAPGDESGKVGLLNFAQRVVASARSIEGVADAAIDVPHGVQDYEISVDNASGQVRAVQTPLWSYDVVSPSYFHVLGLKVAEGRDFTEGVYQVASVVSDGPTARFLWPDASPVGRAVKFGKPSGPEPWLLVSGVEIDARDPHLVERFDPTIGRRVSSMYKVVTAQDSVSGGAPVRLYLRTTEDPAVVLPRVQRQLTGGAPGRSPAVTTILMSFGIAADQARADFVATLFAVFAVAGALLTALGIASIVAYAAVERRREIALRRAIGAMPRDIVAALLREGGVALLGGVAVGLCVVQQTVVWLNMFLTSFGDPTDAPLFAAIGIVLTLTLWVIALVPAWRATRVEPAECLRG